MKCDEEMLMWIVMRLKGAEDASADRQKADWQRASAKAEAGLLRMMLRAIEGGADEQRN